MNIVIDMSEHEYEVALRDGWVHTFYSEKIKNGTILPKGHEALKDAGMIKRFLYSSARFWGTWNLGKHRIFEAIDNVEAVIEADEEADE